MKIIQSHLGSFIVKLLSLELSMITIGGETIVFAAALVRTVLLKFYKLVRSRVWLLAFT